MQVVAFQRGEVGAQHQNAVVVAIAVVVRYGVVVAAVPQFYAVEEVVEDGVPGNRVVAGVREDADADGVPFRRLV